MILVSPFDKESTPQTSEGHWSAEKEDDSDSRGAAKDDQKEMNLCICQEFLCLAQNIPSPPSQTYYLVNKRQKQALCKVLWLSQVARISIYLPTTTDIWLKKSPLSPHMRLDHGDSIHMRS